jgi:hypothetical protein
VTVDADLLRVAAGELEAAAVALAGVEARPEVLDATEALVRSIAVWCQAEADDR